MQAAIGHGDPQVARLFEILRDLTAELDPARLLEKILEELVAFTGAERAFVLYDEEGGFRVAASRNMDREAVARAARKFSRTVLESLRERSDPLVVTDALEDERFRDAASVRSQRLRAILAVPLRARSSFLGAVYLDNRHREGAFDAAVLPLVRAFADQAAIAIANARLYQERVAAETEAHRRREEVEALKDRLAENLDEKSKRLDEAQVVLAAQQAALAQRSSFDRILGRSAPMQELYGVLERVARTDLPVLLVGESGSGKELAARAVHFHGARRDRPFVPINCAGVPETLLEAELFGHTKGAFTGAVRDRRGLFAAADGGTLFLDEVESMGPAMQERLLRVLEDGRIRPVGETDEVRVDVRIVAATNRSLEELVGRKEFRQDLYFRLNVLPIRLPPLRERRDDIPLLAAHFLAAAADAAGGTPVVLAPEAMARLIAHDWPGNVRELDNVLRAAATLCTGGTVQDADVERLLRPREAQAPSHPSVQQYIDNAIRELCPLLDDGEISSRLGISRSTVWRRRKAMGGDVATPRPPAARRR